MKIVEFLRKHGVAILFGSGGIIGIIATFFVWIYRTYLKDWLISKYSLELCGFYWVLIFLAIFLTPILLRLVFWFFKKQFIYKEEGSIKTVLKGNLDRLTEGDELRETIVYNDWDRKYNIKKGGTKRYFKTVLSVFDVWSIESEGEDVILISRDPAEFHL